jgi:hypothetical protein
VRSLLSGAYRRPAPISGLRTAPCSPVQYRHAVNISPTYRWTFHQHAASLLSLSGILLQGVAGPPANACQRPCTQQMRCDVFGDRRGFVWRRHKEAGAYASPVLPTLDSSVTFEARILPFHSTFTLDHTCIHLKYTFAASPWPYH